MQTQQHLDQTPKLDAPGKGLPWIESLILKYWIKPRATKKFTWEKSETLFNSEGKKILDLIQSLTPNQLTKKILIGHIRGIEDSSRFWSVAETLEHLMIVGTNMNRIITELSKNNKINTVVDIARVKPKGGFSGNDAREQYAQFMKTHIQSLNAQVQDRTALATHLHPWCGHMTAHEWLWLMASHQHIHRRQIEQIIQGL